MKTYVVQQRSKDSDIWVKEWTVCMDPRHFGRFLGRVKFCVEAASADFDRVRVVHCPEVQPLHAEYRYDGQYRITQELTPTAAGVPEKSSIVYRGMKIALSRVQGTDESIARVWDGREMRFSVRDQSPERAVSAAKNTIDSLV